jgi:hypothetical protein
MKETTVQFREVSLHPRARVFFVLLLVSSLTLSGCFLRRQKAEPFPWGMAARTRPYPPYPPTPAPDETNDTVPDLQPDLAPPPSSLAAVRSVPARPRVAQGSPPQNEVVSKPDVPQIAPQLSPAEASAAQQQVNESLNVAERNIGATQGRNLNTGQLDLASKVRSFIAEAREAANIGDWTRAKNAAKKAQVLSEELASSM